MGKPLHRRVVPKTYTHLLHEYLQARGHLPDVVLGQPWPGPDSDGLGGVDVDLWEQMLERAELCLKDPLIGLHLGQSMDSRHLGTLGLVLLASDNLREALDKLERFQRLIFDVTPMHQRAGRGWVELVWDISRYRPGRLVNETGFAVTLQFCRSLVRTPVNALDVEFAHPGPPDVRPYAAFFGGRVRFDRPEPLIRFDADLLASPLKSPDPALVRMIERHAEHLLSQLPQEDEVVEQVRKVIARRMREGEPHIESVSAALNCSSRTLQRRLRGAGTGFREELNLLRHQLAASYLRDPRLQVVDIALLLGYSEHSAFTRAFREWTGKTPQQSRELSLSGTSVLPSEASRR